MLAVSIVAFSLFQCLAFIAAFLTIPPTVTTAGKALQKIPAFNIGIKRDTRWTRVCECVRLFVRSFVRACMRGN